MEVITIESSAFRSILRKIDAIFNLVDSEMKEKENEQILDNKSLCTFLKISLSTAQRLRNNGKIIFYQDGRRILYKKMDVEKYISEHKHGEI